MQIKVDRFMKDTFDEGAMLHYKYRNPMRFIVADNIQDKGE
jgi:hypothetical protein